MKSLKPVGNGAARKPAAESDNHEKDMAERGEGRKEGGGRRREEG
jgi:hypothetical protein